MYMRVFIVVVEIFQFWLLLKNTDNLLLRGDLYGYVIMQRKLLGKEVTEEIKDQNTVFF